MELHYDRCHLDLLQTCWWPFQVDLCGKRPWELVRWSEAWLRATFWQHKDLIWLTSKNLLKSPKPGEDKDNSKLVS
jgi:hypothetical protein